jgi:hypothetical protein
MLSLFAYVLAVGALVFPLPLGLAAVLLGVVATVAAKGQRRATILALGAVAAGLLGTAGGVWIGIAITAP